MESSMEDTYTVRPHILRRDVDEGREQVATATVDGVQTLIVPVSEELAHSVIDALGLEGMEALSVTVEELEEICAFHGLATVGLYGLEDGKGIGVLSVEVLGLAFEEA